MRLNFVYLVQISLVLGDIPEFGAAGNYNCNIGDWHFATSFYAEQRLKKAEEKCKQFDCDIIIEWTRKSGSKTIIGWEIGKFNRRPCPQNREMNAKIIWEKSFDDYMDSNQSVAGKI